jgi:Holliday junction resolvase RusA-like endonuclease
MYVYTTRGPRPSSDMKRFKAKASVQLLQQIPFKAEPLLQNTPYELRLEFHLPALVNKGWPKKAKTKYKRKDVSNLIKIIEDLLSWCLGVDDSCFLEVSVRKLDGSLSGFTGVRIEVYEV